MGEGGRRADDDGGIAADRPAHCANVGAELGVDGHLDELHVKVLGGLFKGGVGGHRGEDLGAADAPAVTGPVAVGPHGQQDALGAARGDSATDFASGIASPRLSAQHAGGHGHDLGLKLGGAGPEVGVQGVALGVEGIDAVEKVDVGLVTVVDGAGDKAVLPAVLLTGVEGLHLGQDLVAAEAGSGERGIGGELAAVGFQAVPHSFQDAGGFAVDALFDGGHRFETTLEQGQDRPGYPLEPVGQGFDVHDHLSSWVGWGWQPLVGCDSLRALSGWVSRGSGDPL